MMFAQYAEGPNADRETIALNLQFLDKISGKVDDLSNLLEENSDIPLSGETTSLQASPVKSQRQAAQLSFEELQAKWKSLSERTKKVSELTWYKFSCDIFDYLREHQNAMFDYERSKVLSIGLEVEARRIEYLRKPGGSISHLAKSMRKATQYFRMLEAHYRKLGADSGITDALKKSYETMEENSTNYARMLACQGIKKSGVTSPVEKNRAQAKIQQLQEEDSNNLTELCAHYKNLCGGDSVRSEKYSDKEVAVNVKKEILDAAKTKDSNIFFQLYQDALVYLNKIYDQLMLEIIPDTGTLHPDQESSTDTETMIDITRLTRLLESEAGKRLQGALQFYYEIKCKYLESIRKHHGRDEYIEHQRFLSDYRMHAYNLLLQRYTTSEALENPSLFEQNCRDILNAGQYSTDLLNAIAKHQLDVLAEQKGNPTDEIEPDDSIKKDCSSVASKPTKTKKVKKATTVTGASETLWEQICTQYARNSVAFASFTEQKSSLSEDTIDYLYEAIANTSTALLIDEVNVDAFYELYTGLVENHFIPKEKATLLKLIADNGLAGDAYAAPDAEKLLVKTRMVLETMLNYSQFFQHEQKVKLLQLLGDIYIFLQEHAPKATFKDKGKRVFNQLHSLLGDDFDLQASKDKLSAKHALKAALHTTYTHYDKNDQDREEDAKRTLALPFNTLQRIEAFHKHALSYAFQYQMSWMLTATLNLNTDLKVKSTPLICASHKPLEDAQAEFTAHAVALLELFDEVAENESSPSFLKQYYDFLVHYHATVNMLAENLSDEMRFGFRGALPEWIEGVQSEEAPRLSAIGNTIQAVCKDAPLVTVASKQQEKASIPPIAIPEAFRKLKELNASSKDVLKLIDEKKYWQASALITMSRTKDPQALLLQSFLYKWLIQIIKTNDFKRAFVNSNPGIKTSYDNAVKTLEQTRLTLLNAANKGSLRDICKKEKKANIPDAGAHSALLRYSVFPTPTQDDEKSSDTKMDIKQCTGMI